MSDIIQCPQCDRKLRVPESLRGKAVKCPTCGATFAAEMDIVEAEEMPPADMPTARAGMYGIATKGDAIYVIGGWDGIHPGLQTNEAYHVAKDTWTTETPMPTGRAEAGAAGHGGEIFIVGGSKPAFGASVPNNEAYKP